MRRKVSTFVGIMLLLSILIIPNMTNAQDERCFEETGYCISGPIREYWETNGGLPVFGYPITAQAEETVEDWTGQVQWFERDRLEDHGRLGVMAGRLGARILELNDTAWQTFETVEYPEEGCRYFSETQHSMCEPFRSYWEQNGGLRRFGYPVTEEFTATIGDWTGTIQYFERRRMEHHEELAGTRYEVLLGLLGNELKQRQGGSSVNPVYPPPGDSTSEPTSEPTSTPTDAPTSTPTDAPTDAPTSAPTATEVATTEPTAVPEDTPGFLSEFEAEVVRLTNIERTSRGLAPLLANPELTEAARLHNEDMISNDFTGHEGSDGSSPSERACRAGYGSYSGDCYVSENIGYGYRTPAAAVEGWMNSSGHRTNILNPTSREIGLSYTTGGSWGHYWTMTLGIQPEIFPVFINNDAPHTTTRSVNITLTKEDFTDWLPFHNIDEVYVSEDPAFGDAVSQSWSSSIAFTLSPGNGEKVVYVKLVSDSEEVVNSDSIVLTE